MTAPKRYLVTGLQGQVVQSLIERAAGHVDVELIAAGRPELDLSRPESVQSAVFSAKPDLIISAAAYTAVDQAESDESAAFAANAQGPDALAKAAARLGIPIVHLSTDYVFDGSKATPYTELDPVAPLGVYGRSKLEGEYAVASATDNHVILRTAWVYGPFGKNFLKTMLKAAESRAQFNVVDDQNGNPTSSIDIADALLAISRNIISLPDSALRGVFHMTAKGEATWADFAREIFKTSLANGGPSAHVTSIPSSAYPTPARRPANSRLDCGKLERAHSISLPDWHLSTASTVARLVDVTRLTR
ncbi:dTDP-4-dehydrorhamnose reductase [Rhizobium deserti]|uniref:dTDP-4-dehydrorhamnose reductase n=1 Tax=Rhizobium deserti TaxID=2547961 RepID=A0A4R5UMM5_9HYPH|nr:dTDP-4-dehydrorhamnose reductase [Rhizobium deserti]TDK39147.1 dTDP-4-dehydrorhamnose reductase [Rhizobium deserti]